MPLSGRRIGSAASAADYALLATAVTTLLVLIVLALAQHAYRVHDDTCDAAAKPALTACE